jgi:hypothetical protein
METNAINSKIEGQVTAIQNAESQSQQAPDKSTVLAVLQLLRKYNLKVSYTQEAMFYKIFTQCHIASI